MDETLVTLASFTNPSEAHLLKGLLESRGIGCWVFGELSAAYTPLVGGVRLAVKKSDLEKAQMVLSEEESQE